LDRLARGWTLTDDGKALLGRAEAVEQEVLGLRRAAAGIDALTGLVRISAPPVMLTHLVLPGLTALREEHPGLQLDLIGERREADLIRAEADIVFDDVVDEGAEFIEGLAVEAIEIGEINVLKCRHVFSVLIEPHTGPGVSAEAG